MLRATELPWDRIRDEAPAVALLPFGALEAHGLHLPLSTDTIVAEAVAERTAERLGALLLPAIPYGATAGTAGYPGTVSLAAATVTAITVDIARALDASGTMLVIVNGDWGNRAPLRAAVDLLAAEGVEALQLDYPGFEEAAGQVRESRPAAPGLAHAEELETSLVLALAPELVLPERYVVCYPVFPPEFGTVEMPLHPFSESAVFGDPTTAAAAKGEAILDAVVEASVAAVLRARG
ncbi:creatininase family protein [Rathayibacter sp. VKM Ac-2759]|uniref:creatininase family protein n=1 Tax=Rathayibacter sp. VKM Ac-2759 TaxID=2609252 RepID=UPI001319989A|nr:creatininase family protein [Rathayibacter sp. VKM Ac-2759]QHC65900.1 creatininase family protein [Rathayibacter sp. VKM Ac-2759]